MISRKLQLLIDTVHRFYRRGAFNNIQNIFKRTHPSDIAILFRFFNLSEQVQLFKLIKSREDKIAVISECDHQISTEILAKIDMKEAVEILENCSDDDRADLLGRLPEDYVEEIKKIMAQRQMEEAEGLLQYKDDTAGGLMSGNYFAIQKEATVEDAIKTLQSRENLEMAFYVYVINEHGHLVGVCSLRQLVISPPSTKLKEIMEHEVISVKPETDQEEVAKIVAKYNFLAVPVVDDSNKLLGIVTVDDVLDVIREEATEDFLKMAGAFEKKEGEKVWGTIKSRIKWLLIPFIGGIITSYLLYLFFIDQLFRAPLLLFFPLLLAMGSISGIQSSTVVIGGVASGHITFKLLRKIFLREFNIVLFHALFFGIISFVLVASILLSLKAGLLFFLIFIISLIISTTIGTLTPLLFERLHLDPAITSGPLVTTAIYLAVTFIYLIFTGIIYHKLCF